MTTENIVAGVIGSLIASMLAGLFVIIYKRSIEIHGYVPKAIKELDQIKKLRNNKDQLYLLTLRDLILMNIVFFIDSGFSRFSEMLNSGGYLQDYHVINEIFYLAVSLVTAIAIIGALAIAFVSLKRITRVLSWDEIERTPPHP